MSKPSDWTLAARSFSRSSKLMKTPVSSNFRVSPHIVDQNFLPGDQFVDVETQRLDVGGEVLLPLFKTHEDAGLIEFQSLSAHSRSEFSSWRSVRRCRNPAIGRWRRGPSPALQNS